MWADVLSKRHSIPVSSKRSRSDPLSSDFVLSEMILIWIPFLRASFIFRVPESLIVSAFIVERFSLLEGKYDEMVL